MRVKIKLIKIENKFLLKLIIVRDPGVRHTNLILSKSSGWVGFQILYFWFKYDLIFLKRPCTL